MVPDPGPTMVPEPGPGTGMIPESGSGTQPESNSNSYFQKHYIKQPIYIIILNIILMSRKQLLYMNFSQPRSNEDDE